MVLFLRLRRLTELSAAERLLFGRALLLTGAVRASLWWASLETARRIARMGAAGAGVHSEERIVWAVTAASRYIAGASCLTKALTVQALMARAGLTAQVEIGVAKEKSFSAHAWVVCDGRIVMGAEESPRYARILEILP